MTAQGNNAVALVGQDEEGIRTLPAIARPSPNLPSPDEFKALQTYGEMIAASKLFPRVQTWQAAVVIMQFGQQLGIDPFTALKDIDWIEGKPTANAGLINALIKRDHGGEAILPLECTPNLCRIRYKRREWTEYHEASLSIDDIPQTLKTKDNWKNYPADMLWARSISRIGRQHFADTVKGVYTPDELLEARTIEATARPGRADQVVERQPVAPTAHAIAGPRGQAPDGHADEPGPDGHQLLEEAADRRGLDADALQLVVAFCFADYPRATDPDEVNWLRLPATMAADVAKIVDDATDDQLAQMRRDWPAELAAAPHLSDLSMIGTAMQNAGISSASHPAWAKAYTARKKAIEAAQKGRAQLDAIDRAVDASIAP